MSRIIRVALAAWTAAIIFSFPLAWAQTGPKVVRPSGAPAAVPAVAAVPALPAMAASDAVPVVPPPDLPDVNLEIQAPPPPPTPPPPTPPPPAQTPKLVKPQAPAPPASPAKVESPSSARSFQNVRVDVTITDQTGSNPPIKKMVSVTVVDRGMGSVRSGVTVPLLQTVLGSSDEAKRPMTSYSYRDMGLNLDVSNVNIIDNIVRLRLSVSYNPVDEKSPSIEAPAGTTPASFAQFSQTVTLALQDGKPLVVASSSDPVPSRNRTASLEVKATILK